MCGQRHTEQHDAKDGIANPCRVKAGAGARDLIVFGEDWGAHPSSTQHLIRRIALDGRRVLWANSIGLRQPRLTRSDLARVLRKARAALMRSAPATPGHKPFPTVQPLVLPMARSRAGRAFNRALLRRAVGGAVRASGLRRPVLWTSLPSAADAVGTLGEAAVVYYCGDDFGALTGVDHEAALALEAELVARADLVLAASPVLAARFPSARTRLLAHGVDLALFSTPALRAPDLPADGPVAGFYGTLAPWLDLDLVAGAARLLPEWRFVLIGPVRTDVAVLRDLPNVLLLGPRDHNALAGYAQHWDAGLIPFRDTPQIQACNPLKLREYLAAGQPVIATDFPALTPYAAHVRVVADPAALAAALLQALAASPEASASRRRAVASDSWDARAVEVAALIDGLAA